MVPARPTAMMPSMGRPMPVTRKPAIAGTAEAPALQAEQRGQNEVGPRRRIIENRVIPDEEGLLGGEGLARHGRSNRFVVREASP